MINFEIKINKYTNKIEQTKLFLSHKLVSY